MTARRRPRAGGSLPEGGSAPRAAPGATESAGVRGTLDARGRIYGDYLEQSRTAQTLKDVMRGTPRWQDCDESQRESLEMVATKIARLLHGDPNHLDSWHDITGYSQLVVDALVSGRLA